MKFGVNKYIKVKTHEKQQKMLYTALQFRANSLSRKTLRKWHQKYRLTKILPKMEKTVTKILLGFPFFCLKKYSEGIEDNSLVDSHFRNDNLHYEYQADQLRAKVVSIFKKKQLFDQWKEIALTKRLDFPYSYYNQRLAEKCLKGFMLVLRQKWVKQKYAIMVETFRQNADDRMKAKCFVKLCQNIFIQKKKQYMERVIQDFRKDVLVTKAFNALKLSIGFIQKQPQIINFCTESIQEYETRDMFSNEKFITQSYDNRQVKYDRNTCMFSASQNTNTVRTHF